MTVNLSIQLHLGLPGFRRRRKRRSVWTHQCCSNFHLRHQLIENCKSVEFFWHSCFHLQDVTTTTFPFLEQVSQVWMSLGVYQKSYLAPVHTFYPYMVSSRNFYLKLFPREWRRLSGQVINPQKMAKNQVFFFLTTCKHGTRWCGFYWWHLFYWCRDLINRWCGGAFGAVSQVAQAGTNAVTTYR